MPGPRTRRTVNGITYRCVGYVSLGTALRRAQVYRTRDMPCTRQGFRKGYEGHARASPAWVKCIVEGYRLRFLRLLSVFPVNLIPQSCFVIGLIGAHKGVQGLTRARDTVKGPLKRSCFSILS